MLYLLVKIKIMILLEPEYLPRVNYFKDLSNKNIAYEVNLKFDSSKFFDKAHLCNKNGFFSIRVPTIIKTNSEFQRDIKIDYKKNWINSHMQSLQSSYGKFPYFIFYIDSIKNILNRNHTYLVDLNYDLLSLFLDLLNFDQKLSKTPLVDIFSDKNTIFNTETSLSCNNDVHIMRKDFFLGKNFDYKLSVLDLLFLKGPESGFYIRNF
ncbi:MAG: hypothetical protein CMB81_02005 [Flammeovirgaceae bacterium]|nr:hypothetical protein [Flammeovirgaceae bacterium]